MTALLKVPRKAKATVAALPSSGRFVRADSARQVCCFVWEDQEVTTRFCATWTLIDELEGDETQDRYDREAQFHRVKNTLYVIAGNYLRRLAKASHEDEILLTTRECKGGASDALAGAPTWRSGPEGATRTCKIEARRKNLKLK